jgi:hypothetical protein
MRSAPTAACRLIDERSDRCGRKQASVSAYRKERTILSCFVSLINQSWPTRASSPGRFPSAASSRPSHLPLLLPFCRARNAFADCLGSPRSTKCSTVHSRPVLCRAQGTTCHAAPHLHYSGFGRHAKSPPLPALYYHMRIMAHKRVLAQHLCPVQHTRV